MSLTREQELEAIVRKLVPAWSDIAWCALVWNDHNFSHDEFLRRAMGAAKKAGFERNVNSTQEANEFFAHVDRVLGKRK